MQVGTRFVRWPTLPVVMLAAIVPAYWMLVRSCGYDHAAVAIYAAYVMAMVWLPGHSLLVLGQAKPVGVARSLALGLPLGYAYEILVYLGCAAAGWRDAYPVVNVAGTLGLAGLMIRQTGWRRSLPAGSSWPAGADWVLAGLILVIMGTMAAQMYAPAPLMAGLLQHSTHHDWVYLVSRAAEIRHHWPLEDPSLAGTPLSYHYFLMAHVAAAAQVTGLEIPLVLLRLACVPLAVAMLAQTCLLGVAVGRSAWAGVLAGFLLFATSEVSWTESASGGLFQSLFLSWLYVSPTFFFGMVFMGALLLWMQHVLQTDRKWRAYGVLFLLAVAGTGAKGTTVGPLAAAAVPWCLWQMVGNRILPWRMIWAGAVLGGGFLLAYGVFLRGYSGNGTAFSLFSFPQVSLFWLGHVGEWQVFLEGCGLPMGISAVLAKVACLVVVLAGLNGVLLAGLVHAFGSGAWRTQPFILWLAWVAVACIAFGNLLFLDSHGESYLYLPMKLPLAVLTAAAMSAWWRRLVERARLSPERQRVMAHLLAGGAGVGGIILLLADGVLSWWGGVGALVGLLFLLAPPRAVGGDRTGGLGPGIWQLASALPLLLILVVQVRAFVLSNRSGFALWQVSASVGWESSLIDLQEALGWVRRHTPHDAILISTLFSPDLATPDAAQVVDRTSLDKHYYCSALAERRLFIEGPAYVRDQAESERRMQIVARILRGEAVALPPILRARKVYVLFDRAGPVQGLVPPPLAEKVFENRRIRIYRLPGI